MVTIKNRIFFYSLLAAAIAITGCKKNSNFEYPAKPVVTIAMDDARFKNTLIHFVKDSVYVIASNITLDSGKTLLLDPGTLVKINPGNTFTITIRPGATIEAKGTATEPVVFTSNVYKGTAKSGQWGGIQVFGSPGGKSSGSLNYVRIEFAGGQFRSALLLSGVGKQTSINNIQISYCDVGQSFEFNGGDCNASNLVSFGATASDFYLANGYKGNLQNLLAYRDPVTATSRTNLAGLDIQGNGTWPVISNFTVLGPPLIYATNANYSLGDPERRAGIITAGNAKFHIRNAVVLGFTLRKGGGVGGGAINLDTLAPRSFYVDSRNTAQSLGSVESDISYSVFYLPDTSRNTFHLPNGVLPPFTAKDLKDFLLLPYFKNELYTSIDKFMFTDPFSYYDGAPNPMPKPGSPLLTGANFDSSYYNDPFFKKVTYRGALGTENWMQGWTNFTPLTTDYNN